MNIKNLIFGIAIFILTLSVGIYGINTLYGSSPKYEKYCPNIMNEKECIDFGGTWNGYNLDNTTLATYPEKFGGYCDIYTNCQVNYDNSRRDYTRMVFFIAIPLGIIVIIAGAIIFGLPSVGAGLMAGGIGIILFGVGGFWEFADDWLKFVLSLIGLIIVIFFSYYLNRKWIKKK
jgi:hypothetical protein